MAANSTRFSKLVLAMADAMAVMVAPIRLAWWSKRSIIARS